MILNTYREQDAEPEPLIQVKILNNRNEVITEDLLEYQLPPRT